MPNELDQFLKGVQDENEKSPLLEQPLEGAPKLEAAGSPGKDDESQEPRNRAERRNAARRWEREIQEREREVIEREARLKAVAELQSKAAPSEVPFEWLQMFGDKPETRQAWALQEKILRQHAERNREEIRQELVEDQVRARQEEREAEDELEDIFDEIEASHNIDLSSNSPAARKARSQYLDALSAVSHKNEDGEVDVYGDPSAAYELYELKRARDASPTQQRQKDLASRSMAPSSEQSVSKGQNDAVRDYLRSEGINV